MKNVLHTAIYLTIIFVSASSQHPASHTPPWSGTYEGVLPCADCEGIKTTLLLTMDSTYELTTRYLGGDNKEFRQTGTFVLDKHEKTITLNGRTSSPSQYLIGVNTLTQLDMNGKRITGPLALNYVLTKLSVSLTGVRWKLVELMGKPVPDTTALGKEIYLHFNTGNGRVNGFAGCNSFFGQYELKKGNRISFSKIGSTLMACPDLTIESEFLAVLQKADNYSLNDSSLQLHKARMAPLARFIITQN